MRERWRNIAGFEDCYQVSNLGRVRSLDRTVHLPCGQTRSYKERVLRPGRRNICGHQSVALSGRSYWVHRLVAETFLGPCPTGYEVLHKNDVADDNRVCNLKWGTRQENATMTFLNGVHHQKAVVGSALSDGAKIGFRNSDVAAEKVVGYKSAGTNIRKCCRGAQKTAYGYTWSYA